jgi:DNA-binding MarR family transcriptional regulator
MATVASVKQLDDTLPEVLDHVGWRLWEASTRWQDEFRAGMIALGHGWFGEARANLIAYMEPGGLRQSELTMRSGLTKQAVQQFLDELVGDGVVERRPDPKDRRGKVVVFTAAGHRMRRDANAVKRRIEKRYRTLLGDDRFAQLLNILNELRGSHLNKIKPFNGGRE